MDTGSFWRFALVGLAFIARLYLGYLLVTTLGMGHKSAITLLHALGVLDGSYD